MRRSQAFASLRSFSSSFSSYASFSHSHLPSRWQICLVGKKRSGDKFFPLHFARIKSKTTAARGRIYFYFYFFAPPTLLFFAPFERDVVIARAHRFPSVVCVCLLWGQHSKTDIYTHTADPNLASLLCCDGWTERSKRQKKWIFFFDERTIWLFVCNSCVHCVCVCVFEAFWLRSHAVVAWQMNRASFFLLLLLFLAAASWAAAS